MIKKYIPYFVLLLGAFALLYIMSHQVGKNYTNVSDHTISTSHAETISSNEDLNRSATTIIYSKHARCRMDCRHIDENEVKKILKDGKVNEQKIEEDSRGKTYPLEGVSEGHHLRIVFAPKGNDALEVVTCIDLDNDFDCDCK